MEEIKEFVDDREQHYNNFAPVLDTALKPSDIITFGNYPQTADGLYRKPIEWRVLQQSERELFILSEYILDCKPYHAELTYVTWQNCDLRKWLNNDFYNAAFSSIEKSQIMTVLCTDNGENSPDTEDKVFLLSVPEAKAFTDTSDGNKRRRTIGTEFSKVKKADGCQLYVYDKKVEKDYIVENGERLGCSWWWLRTQQHESSSRADFVGPRSSIRSYGRVNLMRYGVRPALKIKL